MKQFEIGDSFTLENLFAIKKAMNNINQIDRSQYFENYYFEINLRIDSEIMNEASRIKERIKRELEHQEQAL